MGREGLTQITVVCRLIGRRAHRGSLARSRSQQVEQVADGAMGFDRMSQRLLGENPIAVLAPYLFPLDESAGFQFNNNSLHGTLGDADLQRDFAERDLGMSGQQNQDV